MTQIVQVAIAHQVRVIGNIMKTKHLRKQMNRTAIIHTTIWKAYREARTLETNEERITKAKELILPIKGTIKNYLKYSPWNDEALTMIVKAEYNSENVWHTFEYYSDRVMATYRLKFILEMLEN